MRKTLIRFVFTFAVLAPATDSLAQNRCSEIFSSNIFRSEGYLVDSSSATRIAISFDPSKVKPESAEMVVAEFKDLATLVGAILVVPKSIFIKLQQENSAAYNTPHFTPHFVFPVEFFIDRSVPPELRKDIAQISSTVRFHEFSHGIFDASLSRDIPSYKMISTTVKEELKGETFERRYQAMRQYVDGTFGRPAEMSPGDPRYPKAKDLLNKMYAHSSKQTKVRIETNDEVEAIYGVGKRAVVMLQSVTALHELFADVLATLQMQSVSATRRVQETSGFPENHPFIIARSFDRDLSPDGWRASDPHLVFGPTRSFLGPYLENAAGVEAKRLLISKIYSVLKEKVRQTFETKKVPTSEELNKQLIQDLRSVLEDP